MLTLVTAIIKPHKLDEVKDALSLMGVQGLSVSEIQGFGRQKGHTETYRGAEYTIDFLPKLKVEVLTTAADAGEVMKVIASSARTGKIGDGKVWASRVEGVMRIRTGELDEAAL